MVPILALQLSDVPDSQNNTAPNKHTDSGAGLSAFKFTTKWPLAKQLTHSVPSVFIYKMREMNITHFRKLLNKVNEMLYLKT